MLLNIDLDRTIKAGDPLDRNDMRHARAVAAALKAIYGEHKFSGQQRDIVTEELVETAELRVVAIESIFSRALFGPQDSPQTLEDFNQRLQTMEALLQDTETQLRLARAETANVRIISKNQNTPCETTLPLQKTIEGHGMALAQALAVPLPLEIQQALQDLAPGLNSNPIGSTPPNYKSNNPNCNLPEYKHIDILQLVVFYNEDFGIVPQDALSTRVEKFRTFLTQF